MPLKHVAVPQHFLASSTLPGWQQKFDVYGGRPLEKLAVASQQAQEGNLLTEKQRMPGHKDGITCRCCGSKFKREKSSVSGIIP